MVFDELGERIFVQSRAFRAWDVQVELSEGLEGVRALNGLTWRLVLSVYIRTLEWLGQIVCAEDVL